MQERNDWVDCAKAIGIVLVVYGHVARGLASARLPINQDWFELVDSIIYSFHMPLFFFLSGLFFHDSLIRRGRLGLIANKVDTIVYPYVVWSLLQGFFEVALSSYTNGHVNMGEVLSFPWQPRAQFWFLYALFQVFVVCSLVYAWKGRRYFLAPVLFFATLYVFRIDHPLSGQLVFVLNSAVFFSLGVWFNEVKESFNARRMELLLLFGALFLAGQYVFHIALGLNYRSGGVQALGLATISIFFTISLSMCLARFRSNWLLFLGASSMSIYVTHILAGSGARVILQKLMGIESIAIHLALGTLAGLGAPLLLQLAIKRYNLYFLLTPPKPISLTSLTCTRSA